MLVVVHLIAGGCEFMVVGERRGVTPNTQLILWHYNSEFISGGGGKGWDRGW